MKKEEKNMKKINKFKYPLVKLKCKDFPKQYQILNNDQDIVRAMLMVAKSKLENYYIEVVENKNVTQHSIDSVLGHLEHSIKFQVDNFDTFRQLFKIRRANILEKECIKK